MSNVLPNSLEAEQAVLECLINDSDRILDIQSIISSSDFYISKHKKIYETINSLVRKNISVDLVTLIEEIRLNNKLDECGGVTYLTELSTSYIAGVNNLVEYANIVKEKSDRRKLILMSRKVAEKAYTENIENIVDDVENQLYKISSSKDTGDVVPVSEALEKTLVSLEERYRNGGKFIGLRTCFKDIDDVTLGIKPKEFTIIAARPSMGKTAFALNVGQAISKEACVAIFSLEMSKEQLMDRMLAAKCMIDFSKVSLGNLDDKEFEKISRAVNDISTRKLFIDDTSSFICDIKAKCKRLKLQNDLKVVLIDYLQLIRTTLNTTNREQEVSYISRELKALAKDLDISVIALSQLSRAPETRADHRPMLSDLRESGSIEQDADLIHFLYRDEYYNKETEDKNIAEVITAKNRNGQTKTTKLAWLGKYQRFGNLDVIRR